MRDRFDFHGKTALVTGSTKGIGFAIAQALAAEGANVIVNGRSEASTQTAAQMIGKRARGVAADVSTSAGCEALIKQAASVDILVNNAGIFEPKPFLEIPDADWERFYQTNVMSGVRLTRAYLPGMLTRNWGRIVFISSESGIQIPEEMIHYGMTKAAELNAQASRYFDAGTEARETANKYVRLTVLFASVLFFVAVAQRFRLRGVRIGANAIAFVLLAYTVYGVGSLPRI